MRPNLVLARVGAQSLHAEWIDPSRPRSWDLRLVPFQPLPSQGNMDCTAAEVVPGPKWSGIRDALATWDGWRSYERIWIPDDDIRTDQQVINMMFEIADAVGLDLFAPALDEASYFAHFSTMRNQSFSGRMVGFVEIMAPGFRTAVLERLLPTLDQTDTGWGWGLDSVWPKLLHYRNVGVIDATSMTHTRPVGQMRDPELRRRIHDESDRLLREYDCAQVHTTFGAFGADLQPSELDPEQLLDELVRGWDYLIEHDPRILSWIVDFHRQHFAAPTYPTEGTPSTPPGRLADQRLDPRSSAAQSGNGARVRSSALQRERRAD
jgi:hypothetical protein